MVIENPRMRSPDASPNNLPIQLTSFVGRGAELAELAVLLRQVRLVTVTGSGGAGKTRLALQAGPENRSVFPDGVWLAELAPVADPGSVATAVATALGLRDEPLVSAADALIRHLAGKQALVILDNCEHVIGASAGLVETLLRACPGLVILATSREPLGVGGEVIWRVPPLTLPAEPAGAAGLGRSEAVALFLDRARLVRPEFELTAANSAAVAEIVRRLDGIPLAIELAAARVKAFTPQQIASMLHDRFNLLTGGARTAVPRQQALRASVGWSHDLLTEPERVLFRRLAVFVGGFDLAAAEAVGRGDEPSAHQVADQLALLVDKSLVTAEAAEEESRYRLLETVRQFAAEHLAEAGEEEDTRRRHRDHYLAFAERTAAAARSREHEGWVDRLEAELDNIRVAFWWSSGRGDAEEALRLATACYFVWYERARIGEGVAWLEHALLGRARVPPAIRIEGLTAASVIAGTAFEGDGPGWSTEAVALARDLDDRVLLMRAYYGAGGARVFFGDDSAAPYFSAALQIANEIQERWLTAHVLLGLSLVHLVLGDASAARALAIEGRDAAAGSGWGWAYSGTGWVIGMAMVMQGDLADARSMLEGALADFRPGWGARWAASSFFGLALVLLGHTDEAIRHGEEAVAGAHEEVPFFEFLGAGVIGAAHLAEGAIGDARVALRRSYDLAHVGVGRVFTALLAEAELAAGDPTMAGSLAAEAMAAVDEQRTSWYDGWAFMAGARVALAEGRPGDSESLAHRALSARQRIGDKAGIADTLEFIAGLAADAESPAEAVRLLAAAGALRDRIGYQRYRIYDSSHAARMEAVEAAMGRDGFDATWAAGASLSMDQAVAYAARGRGERKRPSAGWASLTPAEHDVVALVAEGLSNKDIAQRLFISPRTVQTHLTHVYNKLDISSRLQLSREANRRAAT